MITMEKFEQYIQLKEEIENHALEVFEIYIKIKYPGGNNNIWQWNVSSIEQGYKSPDWFVYFENTQYDDRDSIPVSYLFEPDPEAKIREDYEEECRVVEEKKEQKKREQEEHMEEL